MFGRFRWVAGRVTRNLTRWRRLGSASAAAWNSCPSASMPASAPLAAGSPGTGRTGTWSTGTSRNGAARTGTTGTAARGPSRAPSAGRWSSCAIPPSGLARRGASDRAQAFAVIGEAVWWVTIVDATLVRYYPDEYDSALAGLPGWQWWVTEGDVRRPAVRAEPDGLLRRSRRLHPAPAGRGGGRRRADHRVELAVAARPDPGDPAAARPGMGAAQSVPGVRSTGWPAARPARPSRSPPPS